MDFNIVMLVSSSFILLLGLVSFIIFLFSFRKKSFFHKSLLRQWALGFSFIAWLRLPTFLTSIGFELVDIRLYIYYLLAFVVSTAGYLLLYRGAVSLFTKRRFWLNIFPIIVFSIFVPAILLSIVFISNSLSVVIWAINIFNYLVILFLIITSVKYLYKKSKSKWTYRINMALLFHIVGWFIFALSDFYILYYSSNHFEVTWLDQLFNLHYAYAIFSLSHLFVFVGLICLGSHVSKSKPALHKSTFSFAILTSLFFIVVNGGLVVNADEQIAELLFVSETPTFIKINDDIVGSVKLNSRQLVNAVDVEIKVPNDTFKIVEINKDDSIIKLWIEGPVYDKEREVIKFSGIIVGGFSGEGEILKITLKPKRIGSVIIDFTKTVVLAHDGVGTQVFTEACGRKYYVRGRSQGMPVVDSTGTVTIKDLSVFLYNMGESNRSRAKFDLNADGHINLIDLSILVSLIE